VQASALVLGGHVGQAVGGFELERRVDPHLDPRVAQGREACDQPPVLPNVW
jgi:hypothetical protein